MCLAIPRKVLRVDGARAEVDHDGKPTWVEAVALPSVQVGQYVIVYAGLALETIPEEEACELLALLSDLEAMAEEASL